MRIFMVVVYCFGFVSVAKAEPEIPLQSLMSQQPAQKEAVINRRVRTNSARSINAPPFIRGRLVCARNVNAALAQRGIKGTGSALAFSFLRWGRSAGPQPGAVRVSARRGGGHVMIVSHLEDGEWICLNPSSRRQQWQLVPCNRGSRALAYRVA